MLENKKLNMVISLLIAIALWAFVIGEVNPQATHVYREIPVELVNEEVLTENGMAVYSVSDRVISITLTGTRSEINKVDEKEITASVDLEDAVIGENQLTIDVKVPDKVEIETQSIESVTVTVEERVSKEVPVEIFYEGTFAGEEEPITVEQNLEAVSVSGAATTVDQVAAARAAVEEGTVTEDTTEVQCDLIAVDANGQRVFNVSLSEESVSITTELVKLKTVPLEVPLEGEDNEDIKRTVTAPDKVTIKGKASDLEDIDSIETEPINLEEILVSTTVPLEPILPEGVALSKESEDLSITIQVTEIKTKSLSFNEENIELRNLGEGLKASVDAVTVKAELTGSEVAIDGLSEEDIVLYVDLTDLQEGKHKIDLIAECSVEGVQMAISPKRITVIIEKEDADPDQTEPDHGNAENNGSDEQIENNEE